MRIYLDACCLQRPFDDQTQPRIRVESEAVLAVLAAIEAGDAVLLTSEALDFEVQRIPDEHRRTEALAMLALAKERLTLTDETEALATKLEQAGVTAMDALHAALASEASADFFATTDDRLLRKLKSNLNLKCQPITLLALVSEVTK
jgi:predicted nucleic acid-binding protein